MWQVFLCGLWQGCVGGVVLLELCDGQFQYCLCYQFGVKCLVCEFGGKFGWDGFGIGVGLWCIDDMWGKDQYYCYFLCQCVVVKGDQLQCYVGCGSCVQLLDCLLVYIGGGDVWYFGGKVESGGKLYGYEFGNVLDQFLLCCDDMVVCFGYCQKCGQYQFVVGIGQYGEQD